MTENHTRTIYKSRNMFCLIISIKLRRGEGNKILYCSSLQLFEGAPKYKYVTIVICQRIIHYKVHQPTCGFTTTEASNAQTLRSNGHNVGYTITCTNLQKFRLLRLELKNLAEF